MVYFQTKNPSLGQFWRVFPLTMLVYFMGIWSFLLQIGIFYGHFVYYTVNWYSLWAFCI
jgi:hypothetical protein